MGNTLLYVPRGAALPHLPEMLESGLFCDVALAAADSPAPIRCHKLLLAAWSPPFQRMFGSGTFAESTREVVQLCNVDDATLRRFLCLLYGSRVEVSYDSLIPLYCLAEQYDVGSVCTAAVGAVGGAAERAEGAAAVSGLVRFFHDASAVMADGLAAAALREIQCLAGSAAKCCRLFVAVQSLAAAQARAAPLQPHLKRLLQVAGLGVLHNMVSLVNRPAELGTLGFQDMRRLLLLARAAQRCSPANAGSSSSGCGGCGGGVVASLQANCVAAYLTGSCGDADAHSADGSISLHGSGGGLSGPGGACKAANTLVMKLSAEVDSVLAWHQLPSAFEATNDSGAGAASSNGSCACECGERPCARLLRAAQQTTTFMLARAVLTWVSAESETRVSSMDRLMACLDLSKLHVSSVSLLMSDAHGQRSKLLAAAAAAAPQA